MGKKQEIYMKFRIRMHHRKRPHRRSKSKWESIIKFDLKVIGYNCEDWIK
jgi:hypothetical protein